MKRSGLVERYANRKKKETTAKNLFDFLKKTFRGAKKM
jgi:hypothetical protein